MAVKSIQSDIVPLELTFDNGTTYKDLVCLESDEVSTTNGVTENNTYCGTENGIAKVKVSISGTGVCNPNLDANTEVTYKDLLSAQVSRTAIGYRKQSGSSGANFYLAGTCYVTDLKLQGSATQVIKFTFTLTCNDDVDLTA